MTLDARPSRNRQHGRRRSRGPTSPPEGTGAGSFPWLRALVLIAAFLCASAENATAQTIQIRSGEHADFSRLVIVVAPRVDWRLVGEGRTRTLILGRTSLRLDPAEVFRFIPRQRLRNLQAAADAPELTLTLACDCPVRAFEDRPGILVLDILDPPADMAPPDPEGPAAQALPGSDLPTIGLARELLSQQRFAAPTSTETPTANAMPIPSAPHGAFAADGPMTAPEPAPSPPADNGSGRQMASEIGERLVAAIARAASQGLISPPAPGTDRRPDHRPEPPVATGAAPTDPEEGPAASGESADDPDAPGADHAPATTAGDIALPDMATALPGLRTSTAVDLGLGSGLPPASRTDATRCLPDSALDLPAWGGTLPPAQALGSAIAETTGEFDRIDPDAVRRLVRLYLYLGFGAEARATLRAFAPTPRDGDATLLLLARILDTGSDAEATTLWQMTECPGLAALWAVLARPDLPDEIAIHETALLQGFVALPAHLRRHLGPILAERLSTSGRNRLAQAVIEAVRHTAGDNEAALQLARTRVAVTRGEAEATAGLQRLSEARGEAGFGARVLLAESLINRGLAPNPGLLADLEAEAFMRRGTDEAERLLRVVVLGHAAVGDFPAALTALERADGEFPASNSERPPLWTELLIRATRDTADIDFLRVALSLNDWRSGQGPAALRISMADRFLDLGLAGLAVDALDPEPTLAEERLRSARANLALGQAAEGLRALAGLDGPEAAGLRGAALARLGDPAGALAAFERAGDEAAMAALAWREGLWDRVRAAGDPVEIRVLDSSPRPAESVDAVAMPDTDAGSGRLAQAPEDTAPQTLALAHALVADSRDLRGGIARLLDRHRAPDASGAEPSPRAGGQ